MSKTLLSLLAIFSFSSYAEVSTMAPLQIPESQLLMTEGASPLFTEIASMEEAQSVYDSLPSNLNKNFGTQCGDRAHIWAYLMKKHFNIESQKVFLYFTPKSFNYTGMGWGFHVATMIVIKGEEYVIEKIPQYETKNGQDGVRLKDDLMFKSPVPLKSWLKFHTGFESCKTLDMFNPTHKKDFKPFKSQRVYKSSDDCVIAKTPAAYWWPNAVEWAVRKSNYYSDPNPSEESTFSACMNTLPAANNELNSACKTLLGM